MAGPLGGGLSFKATIRICRVLSKIQIPDIPNLLNESLGETSNLFLNVPWASPITSLVKTALLSSKTKEGPDYSGTFVFRFFFFFGRTPWPEQDLSSLTRDRTLVPCS